MTVLDDLIATMTSGKKVRIAGLMSGTSIDGIDVAIIDIRGTNVRLTAFDTFPYRPALRTEILALCHPDSARVDRICRLNHVLGEVFAEAVIGLCRRRHIRLSSIDLIGSHGQTIWHQPQPGRCGGRMVRSTLQIGEPSVIAQRTGITTVADFRPRDMAAGGQGAPLVPYSDYVLFRGPRTCRTVQNIGGIANVTFLPPACTCDDIMAFDTGPGNMVIDGVMRLVTNGRHHYDRGGALAAKGRIDEPLLREMLGHPFLRRKPPKSTGREEFGRSYCEWFYGESERRKLAPEDMLATVTAFTARTVADAYRRFLPETPDEMILCGGGAHNRTLVRLLREDLGPVRIRTTDEFGVGVDAREAVAFAILAWATIRGIANNVPRATGAAEPVVLGKIVPGR
jgi:anhydro-N-acetylmuramic acid kinase